MSNLKLPTILLIFLKIYSNVHQVSSAYFPKACLPTVNFCFIGAPLTAIEKHTKFESYLGIPYAKPPVGNLRFKRPEPYDYPGHLDNCTVFLAMTERPDCLQYDYRTDDHPHGCEDCLYLNVYRPRGITYDSPKLPVLIEYSDIDFERGSASSGVYGPEILMAYGGLILVTVNTRLSIFGYYFNTDQRAGAPSDGNMGLWDHLLALQWVNRFIAGFGGDIQKVTVAGEASVSYLILNKVAMPMINNAIIRYTNFISEYNRPWEAKYYGFLPQHTFDDAKEAYLRLLLKLDAYPNLLQSLDGISLLRHVYNEHLIFETFPEFRFKPVVDAQFKVKNPFLWAHPITLWFHKEHTFPKPICLIYLEYSAFDLLTSLLKEGYDEINIKDTEDPEVGKTQVSRLISLFLSTDWKSVTQLTDIFSFFFLTVEDETAIRNLKIDKANIIHLVWLLTNALFTFPLMKMMNLRPLVDPASSNIFVMFNHLNYDMKSWRSRYFAGENFKVFIPFMEDYIQLKMTGVRGDDNCFLYTSTDFNHNPPPKFGDQFKAYFDYIKKFIDTGTYVDGDKKQNCQILGTTTNYNFKYCTITTVSFGDDYKIIEPFKNITYVEHIGNNDILTRSFKAIDPFLWGTLRGYNYTRRQVPNPTK